MSDLRTSIFRSTPTLIGMVHVRALPGTPRAKRPVRDIVEIAAAEAAIYESAGFDAVLIENMHDIPYVYQAVGPEVTAAMTAVAVEIRRASNLPIGVQVLAACNREALAVALAADLQFIRCENFAYAHVADEGLMPLAEAGPLLRYRRQIGADHVRIFADVKKKHAAHALTGDLSLAEAARGVAFCGADGVIVTGSATGVAAATSDVDEARAARLLVLIGSGVTASNLHEYWRLADGFIVGSSLKHDGDWSREIDPTRVAAFVARARELRAAQGASQAGNP